AVFSSKGRAVEDSDLEVLAFAALASNAVGRSSPSGPHAGSDLTGSPETSAPASSTGASADAPRTAPPPRAAPVALAIPQSITSASPNEPTITFPGFRSL